jgi:GAF domain-containing protein
LRQAERHIDSVREDHYLTNEDLRAANEELQSLNEEYRSTTEELETSKEELQSSNEELQTVNHELKMKVDEISRAHNDLGNLMAATDVAILFLNSELRIKRFTPQLSTLFNIKSQDYDRPIGDLTHSLDYGTLESDARAVLATTTAIERTATNTSGVHSSSGSRRIARRAAATSTAWSSRSSTSPRSRRSKAHSGKANAGSRGTRHHAPSARRHDGGGHRGDAGRGAVTSAELGGGSAGRRFRRGAAAGARLGQLARRGTAGIRPRPIRSRGRRRSTETSACGRALRTLGTIEVADVMSDPDYVPMRDAVTRAGYRAVQCTPLRSREGELVGLVSVYFRKPHVFSERDKQLGSLIGQQAADLIVRNAQQDQLQRLNDDLRERTALSKPARKNCSARTAIARSSSPAWVMSCAIRCRPS